MKTLSSEPVTADINNSNTNAYAAAGEPGRRLPRLRLFRFHSIRTRGMVAGTGLVLLVVIVAIAAYSLSLRAY